MSALACGPAIHPGLATVAPEQLKPPRTLSLSASSSLHGPSIADDVQLLRKLTAAVHRYLPQVSVVDGLGDLDVIVVLVNYEPGCAPKCGKFPTYRNWSCTVLSRVPFAQAFALEGSTINRFVSPTDDCMRRLAEYLRKKRSRPLNRYQHFGPKSVSLPRRQNAAQRISTACCSKRLQTRIARN